MKFSELPQGSLIEYGDTIISMNDAKKIHDSGTQTKPMYVLSSACIQDILYQSFLDYSDNTDDDIYILPKNDGPRIVFDDEVSL